MLRFVIYKLCMNKKLHAHLCARLITVPEWTTDAAIIHTSNDSYGYEIKRIGAIYAA